MAADLAEDRRERLVGFLLPAAAVLRLVESDLAASNAPAGHGYGRGRSWRRAEGL